MNRGILSLLISMLMLCGCMFSTPMTSRLVTINRNKILITNGKYCKWSGLPEGWEKSRSVKGAVRYFNESLNAGMGIIATCPIRGEKRNLKVLSGELSSSIDEREFVSETFDGRILWQTWKGKLNSKDINMKIAVIKDIGCALDFSLISEMPFDEKAVNDYENAVKSVDCEGNLRWK